MTLIDKSVLVAEIERRIKTLNKSLIKHPISSPTLEKLIEENKKVLSFIDTLEVKEVDLEEEIDRVWDNTSDNFTKDDWKEFEDIAKHFFELGLKAQKGE